MQGIKPTMGTTQLWKPLLRLNNLTSHYEMRNVFLFSDGHISDEVSTLSLIKDGKLRIFTFGIRYIFWYHICTVILKRIFYCK